MTMNYYDYFALPKVRGAVEESIKKLGFSQDLFLIHNPFIAESPADLKKMWQIIEDLKAEGVLKDVGFSSFRPQLEAAHQQRKTVSASPITKSTVGDILIYLQDMNVKYADHSSFITFHPKPLLQAQQVLKNIHWQIHEGERWNLQGPNGFVKTTLLAMLAGDHPQSYTQRPPMGMFACKRAHLSTQHLHWLIGIVSPELFDAFPRRGGITLWDVVGEEFNRGCELDWGPMAERRKSSQLMLTSSTASALSSRKGLYEIMNHVLSLLIDLGVRYRTKSVVRSAGAIVPQRGCYGPQDAPHHLSRMREVLDTLGLPAWGSASCF
ncbi:hypothetical protein FISHEDRAFT_74750 [Fistulina hepatica ATCC 64428]|uniref:NADP-dependent oxidoreductase domain-containing protein n=1 Tax=Fistulina hepatica ATCC 64428 TaxID=1128425 RepID=A0A0D7AAC8_9AGAR|nr:hypothetical protein FISHEDRAFT_74750 [Fistulina hepatica ATCC 64428]